jgi:hypothetical protein
MTVLAQDPHSSIVDAEVFVPTFFDVYHARDFWDTTIDFVSKKVPLMLIAIN